VGGKSSVTRLVLATVATVSVAGLPLSGCSDIGFFPAVHDMPAPRVDAPLTPDQIKQATDALASERDHLNTQLQANTQPAPAANAAAAQQQKPPAAVQSAATQPAVAQTAGADPKP